VRGVRWNRRAKGAAGSSWRAQRVDPASREVLVRFGFTLVLVIGWYLIWSDTSAVPLSVMALAACACVLAVVVARREPPCMVTLTRWDEAAVWFALACGARLLNL
jgi:hypothetical protein